MAKVFIVIPWPLAPELILDRIDDSTDWFSLTRGIADLAKIHGPERFVPHLEWCIDHARSPAFRTRFTELLIKANALSGYHRREAHFDQNPETQALVT